METLYIGLLGLGTVGSGVMNTLEMNRREIEADLGCRLRIKRALVKDVREYGHLQIPADLQLTENIRDILDDDEIQIMVEVMGGITPAKEFILEALAKGKSVVSANKDLISLHGPEIVATAVRNRADFMCEASVGGGIPILLPLQKSLKANRIRAIVGIINGTTNYILSEMTDKNMSYQDALAAAQEQGYAEADPTSDVGGWDAARKIAILSSIGFHANVTTDDVQVEGIEAVSQQDIQFATEFGYVIKLLAVAEQHESGVTAAVYPAFVSKEHPLAAVRGAYNAVYVVGNAVDDVMFYGKGAGSYPTASAVLGDVMEIAHHLQRGTTGQNPWLAEDNPATVLDPAELENSYYIRMIVDNAPGVLADISRVFAEDGVSIKTMWQRGNLEATAEIVMVVYPAAGRQVARVSEALKQLSCVRRVASLIRVYEEIPNADR
ncbi:MAG: homoserine dehydrogenase [Veillonellaceae bacterium]|nr:homoserine dehydrogenase [Veillonellaceae bacterium]